MSEEVKGQREDVVLQPTKTQEKRRAGGHVAAALQNLHH